MQYPCRTTYFAEQFFRIFRENLNFSILSQITTTNSISSQINTLKKIRTISLAVVAMGMAYFAGEAAAKAPDRYGKSILR